MIKLSIFKKRKTVGLVLGSGGIKGLAHIGVIEVLLENNIPIDFVTGTSIGALIGANFALFKDVNKLKKFIAGKHREQLSCFWDLSANGGFVKGDKIKKLLDEWLEKKSFKDTRIPFCTVATDIVTGNPHIFSNGPLIDGVRASISIPSLFKPVEYEEEILVDGGVCDPLPVDLARKMGADIVIAVNLDNSENNAWFKKTDVKSIAKVSGRSLDIMRHYLAVQACKNADVVIEPKNTQSEAMIWKEYFWDGQTEEVIESGRIKARLMIKKIKKLLED